MCLFFVPLEEVPAAYRASSTSFLAASKSVRSWEVSHAYRASVGPACPYPSEHVQRFV